MARRDPEDTFDDAVRAAAEFFVAYGWDFADRVFKALAWLLGLGVLRSVYQRTNNREIGAIFLALGVIWVAAMFGQIAKLIRWIEDSVAARIHVEGKAGLSFKWRLAVLSSVGTALVVVFVVFVFPVISNASMAILDAVATK